MEAFQRIVYCITWIILWPVFRIFFNIRVHSPSGLLKDIKPPILVVANHMAIIDSWLVPAMFPISCLLFPFHHMGETRNFRSRWLKILKFFGIIKFIYIIFGVIPVVRGLNLERVLEAPARALRSGKTVMIYPEGRRVQEDIVERFKRGAAALHKMTGVPILPVSIRYLKRRGLRRQVIVNFGQPFHIPENLFKEGDIYYKDATEYLRQRILKLYSQM